MANQVFRAHVDQEWIRAGMTDLVALKPVRGKNQLFVIKWKLEALVCAICSHEMIHLSGPTGSAKSSLLEALEDPGNFIPICAAMGFPVQPLKLYGIEMACYETPGELYQRRALKDGTTYDEESELVRALKDAARKGEKCYPLIWLREMGRVHSPSVQGGLLNLITRGDILLPDGTRIDGNSIGWVADSNYQAEQDSTHTLVTFDDALRRRFSVNLTLDYLPAELEVLVLTHLLQQNRGGVDADLVQQIVHLGQAMRRYRSEGSLQSVPPPTIYGYLAFFRMAQSLPHLNIQQVAMISLLGNASTEDQKTIPGLFNEVFGLQSLDEEEISLAGNLF